jgi:hypothetical protein
MEELTKIRRVVTKADITAPHEVLLVIDGNTGQNALAQVKAFDEAIGLTGLIVTKLDGTAKGGVLCAIARESRCRCTSSAWARSWKTCRPSRRASSRRRWSGDRTPRRRGLQRFATPARWPRGVARSR